MGDKKKLGLQTQHGYETTYSDENLWQLVHCYLARHYIKSSGFCNPLVERCLGIKQRRDRIHADFLAAIVCVRRSSINSITSGSVISKLKAILLKVVAAGIRLPLNHDDQSEGPCPVNRNNFQYDICKNSSLVTLAIHYADFFAAMVRDAFGGYAQRDLRDLEPRSRIVCARLSSNASINSINDISNPSAALRKVSRVGDVSPLNHLDQIEGSILVLLCNREYVELKNSFWLSVNREFASLVGSFTGSICSIPLTLSNGLKALIKKLSAWSRDSVSFHFNQAILTPSIFWSSLTLLWVAHLKTKLSVIPTYIHLCLLSNTKYTPARLGSFLRCSKLTEGSDRTSICVNSLSIPPSPASGNVARHPSSLLLPTSLFPDNTLLTPVHPFPAGLRSFFSPPISCSSFFLPLIPKILHQNDVHFKRCDIRSLQHHFDVFSGYTSTTKTRSLDSGGWEKFLPIQCGLNISLPGNDRLRESYAVHLKTKRNTYEYTMHEQQLLPRNCIVPFKREDAVMSQNYLEHIPPEREGWAYPIRAESTIQAFVFASLERGLQ